MICSAEILAAIIDAPDGPPRDRLASEEILFRRFVMTWFLSADKLCDDDDCDDVGRYHHEV